MIHALITKQYKKDTRFAWHFISFIDQIMANEFYFACEYNDLVRAEVFLKKMSLKEINYQYSPNNETVLHVAARKQYRQMIELLLIYAVDTQIRDINGKLASDLTDTDEIKYLFQRSKSEISHFAFSSHHSNLYSLSQPKWNCKNCSLINNRMYEWELIDRNAAQKALEFRREFKAFASMNNNIWKKKFYSLHKSYLNAHLQYFDKAYQQRIRTWFENAFQHENPDYLVKAYTSTQQFSQMLNNHMARNVIHSLNNGCSQFSCQCLYETQDGTTTFSSILLHHPNFEKLKYQNEIYRGIVMSKHKLDHYKVGSCIITTTFLSASKDLSVARMFSDKQTSLPDDQSFICTYKLTTDRRTAIDISKISVYSYEDEILILPYSPFLIKKIDTEEDATKIYLEEQSLQEFIEK